MDQNSAKTLIDNNEYPVYIFDDNFNILYMNINAATFAPKAAVGSSFLSGLCGRKTPCPGCPINSLPLTYEADAPDDALCSFAHVHFSPVEWNGQKSVVSEWMKSNISKPAMSQEDMIRSIRTLNLDKALAGLGDDMEAFISVLEVYYNVGLEKPSIIREHYANRDYYNLRIEVHGLKGTSYVIGADALGDFAKKLEFACRAIEDGSDPVKVEESKKMIDDELELLLADYDALEQQLRPIFDSDNTAGCDISGMAPSERDSSDPDNASSITDYELAILITDAKEHLEDYELEETRQVLETVLKSNPSGNSPQKIKQCLDLINRCEYDKAIDKLDHFFDNM